MTPRATPAQDKLARWIADELREKLTVEQIRSLGVPRQVISDAELGAALERDRRAPNRGDVDGAGYDRRGLLNALAWLALAQEVADAR